MWLLNLQLTKRPGNPATHFELVASDNHWLCFPCRFSILKQTTSGWMRGHFFPTLGALGCKRQHSKERGATPSRPCCVCSKDFAQTRDIAFLLTAFVIWFVGLNSCGHNVHPPPLAAHSEETTKGLSLPHGQEADLPPNPRF